MRERRKVKRRMLAGLMFAAIVFSMLAAALPVSAATVTKKEKKYEIAVVYDNSGSMYKLQNQAWCRAKYAMEIFAAMLNYDKGDRLKIYPMWWTAVDGTTPTEPLSEAIETIEINSIKDLDKIHNIYTLVEDANTPFRPVNDAFEDLKKSSADEKWLIVLTDGQFSGMDQNTVKTELEQKAQNGIKVQYLGFGTERDSYEIDSNPAIGFYSKKSTDESLNGDLIEICNNIFQRSELKGKLNNGSLTLDLSMKNIIVFAQGENAEIKSLKAEDGKKVDALSDSGRRTYSELSAVGYVPNPDTSLDGQVVTFAACPKGKYELDCSGAEDIQVFYEPDVDVKVSLVDSDGRELDPNSKEILIGDYELNFRMVDSQTGEDVAGSELLGEVKLEANVEYSDGKTLNGLKNGDIVTLESGIGADINVEGSYLKDYRISTKDSGEGLHIDLGQVGLPEQPDVSVDVKVLQPGSYYYNKEFDSWQPIRISLLYGGAPFTQEQFANLDFSISFSDEIKYTCSALPQESAYEVYICTDENGNFSEAASGRYSITAKAAFTDEYGQQKADEDKAGFEIQWYSRVWHWLIWFVILAAIIILVTLILNHPVLPSAMYLNMRNSCQPIRKNGDRILLSTDLYPGELSCEAKACTPLKRKGKKSAKFKIKRMKALGSVLWYEIDGTRFTKVKSGKYVNDDGETIEDLKTLMIVSDGTEIKWKTNNHVGTGDVYINHNN